MTNNGYDSSYGASVHIGWIGQVSDAVTLGATWVLSNKSELSFAYMHAFEEKVRGNGSIHTNFGGGEANLKMYQDSLGIAYGWQL